MNKIDFAALRAPFSATDISWKKGLVNHDAHQAQALPYINARAVQERLDTVVGPERWSETFTEVHAGDKLVAARCTLSIQVGEEWVRKEDAAPFTTADLGLKGMYSDALKRAAVHWGIGRYLYAFTAPYVDLNEAGNFDKQPTLPADFLPDSEKESALSLLEASSAEELLKVKAIEAAAQAAKVTANAEQAKIAEAERLKMAKEAAETIAKELAEADAASLKAAKEESIAKAAKASADKVKLDEARALLKAEEEAQTNAIAQAAAASVTEAALAPSTESNATSVLDGPPSADNTSPTELLLVTEMLGKIKTMSPKLLESYLNGAKAKEKLSEHSRLYLLNQLALSVQTAATNSAKAA
ncbi:MAG: Rad52/Rad22 family DNA repair protein [Agitococcus sp.]|nr:Rad52/Rad22 family DNA repair protein [Agitococcus sp.]